MIQVSSYSLIKRSFHLLADLNPINCFHRWPVVTSSFWDVCHKPTTSLCFSLLIFQQLRSILLCKDAFQTHLWQKLAFSSPFCYSIDLSSILSSRGIVMLLFYLIIPNCEDHVLFMLIHLTGVSCFHSSSLILSSFASFLNRRAVWNLFTPCAILSIVLEVVSSSILSSCKFMFYSFHVQTECCPNSSSLTLF